MITLTGKSGKLELDSLKFIICLFLNDYTGVIVIQIRIPCTASIFVVRDAGQCQFDRVITRNSTTSDSGSVVCERAVAEAWFATAVICCKGSPRYLA